MGSKVGGGGQTGGWCDGVTQCQAGRVPLQQAGVINGVPLSSPLWRSPTTATWRMELQSLGGAGAGLKALWSSPWLTAGPPGATILPTLRPKQKIRARLAAVRSESRPLPCRVLRCRPQLAPPLAPSTPPFIQPSGGGRYLRDAEESRRGSTPARLRATRTPAGSPPLPRPGG